MQPHNRRMEKTWLYKQNLGHKSHPRRPKSDPISVEWKKHCYKSETMGLNAAPAGVNAAP